MYTNFSARALGLSLSAEDAVDLAADVGFAGVDLLVRDFLHAGGAPKELRRRMDGLGLKGGTWPLPVEWRGTEAEFARDLERLPPIAEAAAVLGLDRTGTWVLPETPDRPDSDAGRAAHYSEVVGWHVRRLGALARVLGRFGVRLGLEVIGVESFRTGRGLPFVHRMADLDRILGTLWDEAPNLGVLVDGFHLYAAGEEIEAGLAWGAMRVVNVHIADLPASATPDRVAIQDRERGLPGENGAIDSRYLLARLAEQGYDGPVMAEPLAGCRSLAGRKPEQTARLVAAALHAVWPSTVTGYSLPKARLA